MTRGFVHDDTADSGLPVKFKSVLLVEDDPLHAGLIEQALKPYTQEVRVAADLDAALEVLKSFDPDLIITDLHLPNSTDVLDIEKIKKGREDSPIVVLTPSTSLKGAAEAMRRGARDFVVKDFENDFKEMIGFSLGRLGQSLAHEKQRHKAKREMDVLRVAAQNSHQGLAVIDGDGSIVYANRAFGAFIKRCGGSDRNVLEMFSPQVKKAEILRENLAHNLKELAAGGVWHTEVTFVHDNAAAFDLSLSVVSASLYQNGRVDKDCLVWARDVSEIRRRERFQREILSTTTHDLKGPLGSIALSAEMLVEMLGQNDKARELAVRIGSAAEGAVQLIDQFMSAKRIEAGAFVMKPGRQNIRELLGEVVDSFKAMAAARGIEIRQAVSEPCEGCVDRLGFSRVAGNLLSNALKYTPQGGTIRLKAENKGGDLELEVQDTGSGLDPSEVEKIFERYTRLERHEGIAGSGLGLFIVKNIVAAHGGKIEVTSGHDQGTTFRIVFPGDPPVNEHGELFSLDFT